MSYRHFAALCVGLLLAVAPAGCGPGNPLGREAISGQVTLDGEPLPFGNISFLPEERDGGIQSGALIQDGVYSMDVSDGLPPGKYKVWIHAAEENPSDMKAPDGGELPAPAAELPGRPIIPARYNVESDIFREVTAGGDNRFDFEVTTP